MTVLESKHDFSSAEARKEFAEYLARLLESTSPESTFQPFRPNDHDDTYWTIDSGNNWKVQFFPEQPNRFGIVYRYQCEANPFEEALAGWLKVTINAQPVEAP